MTVFMETVRVVKSRLRKQQSEGLDYPQDYGIQFIFLTLLSRYEDLSGSYGSDRDISPFMLSPLNSWVSKILMIFTEISFKSY